MAEESFFDYEPLAKDPDSKIIAGPSRGSPGHRSRSSGSLARSGRLLDTATDLEGLITEQLSLQHVPPYSESLSERPVPELENDLYTGDSTNLHIVSILSSHIRMATVCSISHLS